MDNTPGEITVLLTRLRSGDKGAESELAPLVYDELRQLAYHYMRRERPDHTLQATALVHEAFIRLLGGSQVEWQDRAHFFAVAAQVMRRILVDHARSKQAEKRPGRFQRVSLESALVYTEEQHEELLALDEALERLCKWDGRQSQIVELRFFAGLSIEETAEVIGVSTRTVRRDWDMAKAWLYGQLARGAYGDPGTLGTS